MTPDPLERILEAIEAQAELLQSMHKSFLALHAHDAELGDSLLDLEKRLSFIAGRARVLVNMKASTRTTTCLRCSSVFASEPGPELCGPCWTELGRPARYLVPVPPIGA